MAEKPQTTTPAPQEQAHAGGVAGGPSALAGLDPRDERESAQASVNLGAIAPAQEAGMVLTGLAELPPEAEVDTAALGRILGRSRKTIQRAVRRGELPAPFRFMGRNVWLVSAILDHFRARQKAALKLQAQRNLRRSQDTP